MAGIDRIQPARPPWWDRRSATRIKILIFLGPSKCPIDLFEIVSNRTVLKRLHARSDLLLASVLHARQIGLSSSRPPERHLRNGIAHFTAWHSSTEDSRVPLAAAASISAPSSCKRAEQPRSCLLYTSPSPRDKRQSRMPSSA